MTDIRPITIDELFNTPGITDMLDEYDGESAINGMPKTDPQWDTYRFLEENAKFQVIGAYHDDQLLGFVTVMVQVLPHYGKPIGMTESLFVRKQYRSTGAGLQLIRAAEEYAAIHKAVGFLVSAPALGKLERLMRLRSDYDHSNTVFFKRLRQWT